MKEIPLTQGYVALVDDQDYERVSQYNWYAAKIKGNIYAVSSQGGGEGAVRLHRFILGLSGSIPWIDHKNHNGLDCQRENLRLASPSQNQGNKRKQTSLSCSRYKGVTWAKEQQKWKATIHHTYLGYFESEEDAAKAYDKAAKEYFKEYAFTNF